MPLRINRKKIINRILALIIAVAIITPAIGASGVSTVETYALNKKMTLEHAKSLALANSMAIEKTEGKINTNVASLKQKLKAISLKKKKLSSFSWSPLFSFKFPEKPSFTDEYAFAYEPVQIQGKIDNLTHQLTADKLKEYNKVQGYFVSIVSSQKKMEFNQLRLDSMKKVLAKNKARLLTGEAKESDVKAMEASVKNLENSIVSSQREFEAAKKKLSTAIDLDVSTGYDFENPFTKADISRDMLDSFIQYTLDHDQNYYEACTNYTVAKVSLQTDYNLICGHYRGSDVDIVRPYVTAALNGQKMGSQKAFKAAYDRFIAQIDSYWQGYKKILFFKIPKEWFKGARDGVGYIEDEPYAMYESALECQDAMLEKQSMEAELKSQVEDNFNTYISMRNAYLNNEALVENAKKQLDNDSVLNRLGELSYEEYKSSQESYEGLEQDLLQSLADYSQTLYNFDLLTCGAVSAYLAGEDTNMFAVGNGVSYIDEEMAKGAYYYLNSIVQNQEFVLTIHIPDDFDVSVTDYELHVNGTVIGDKTSVDTSLRHLSLVFNDVNKAFIRFYNGSEVVCDCDIDPTQYSGELSIVKSITTRKGAATEIGTYSAQTTEIGTVKLNLSLDEKCEAAFFRMKYNDKYVGGESLNDIKKTFIYLSLMTDSMSDIDLEFFDKDGKQIFTGYFDTNGGKVKKNE